jgi:hypothetical protein
MQEQAPDVPQTPPAPPPEVPEVIDHRLTRLEENLMHESHLREQQHEQIVALLKLATQLTQRIKGLEARFASALQVPHAEAHESQIPPSERPGT